MPGMVEHRFFKRQLLIYLCMIPALCSLACTAGCTILNPAVSTRSAIRWDAELTWLTQDNIPIAGTRVEIADTREERLKGLKGRRLSGDEEGVRVRRGLSSQPLSQSLVVQLRPLARQHFCPPNQHRQLGRMIAVD